MPTGRQRKSSNILNGAGSVRMAEVQRARLFAATVDVVSDVGYGGMSVGRVTSRAGVSRRTFYELFDDLDDCFLAVFDDVLARVTMLAGDAYEREMDWRERIRAGLGRVLECFQDDPRLGALLVVHALSGGRTVFEHRARALEDLASIIDGGRSQDRDPGPPPLTAEGVVGAVVSVLHARLSEPEPESMLGLLNPLMAIIVLPYLGQAAANMQLEREIPVVNRASPRPMDPLSSNEMRWTYRTLRVIETIAADPGASNRKVADAAGISDQGQMSKLLKRLQERGMIENKGLGHIKGEPNAWTLTPKGDEVQRAIQTQAAGIPHSAQAS